MYHKNDIKASEENMHVDVAASRVYTGSSGLKGC